MARFKVEDLRGDRRGLRLAIAGVSLRDRAGKGGRRRVVPVLRFEGEARTLPLSRARCWALMRLAGSERPEDWPGLRVALYRARARGRPTIALRAAGGRGR